MKQRFILILVFFCFFLSCLVIYCNAKISFFDKFDIIEDHKQLPHQKVALVLGTSKYLVKGGVNQFYQNRIDAAVNLFQNNVVDYLLLSGDNHEESYNEPQTMKNDLLKRGIPDDRIVLDYAGFRTLDSVVRAKKVFGQKNIIIVSQQFHLERALFLAYHNGVNAIGFSAGDVDFRFGIRTLVRETFARVKVFYDLLLGVEPYFLGEPVSIPVEKRDTLLIKKDSTAGINND